MLGTLLEASPAGARWPSFREAGSLITRGLRVRGWVWLLAMLWVALGVGGAIYAVVAISHPTYSEVTLIPPAIQWLTEPAVISDAIVIAELAWVLLSLLLPVAGFVGLRGWRPRNWLRLAGWAGSWVAGLALMNQAADWVAAGEVATHGVLSVGVAVCAAWLVLGSLMTWILAVPARRSDVADTGDPELRQTSA